MRTKANKAGSYVLTLKLQKGTGCEHHMVVVTGGTVTINKDSVPCKTLAEAIQFLRSNPDQLTVPMKEGIPA